MTRAVFLGCLVVAALCAGAGAALAQDDEAQAVIDQCSDPAPDAVDACLERARVAEETTPTKELQNLVARLIVRQASAPSTAPAPDAPAGDTAQDNSVAPVIDTTEPVAPTDQTSGNQDAPPDVQPTPADMSPPDNTAPPPTAADTEPPEPPAGSPHN